MLEIQKKLKEEGFASLDKIGIKTTFHPNKPLVILNYSQIDSPKTHPVVRECRGLVLHSKTFNVIAKGFNRFFNWGEVRDEMDLFDFSNFMIQSKEDGSLCLIYFYDGLWYANTRNSFGEGNIQYNDITWQEGFIQALNISSLNKLNLDKSVCYVCEFCSPYNKIVRYYSKPQMYLLTAFRGSKELPPDEVDYLADDLFFRPNRYNFSSMEEIQEFLQTQQKNDPTFEGVVICDKNGLRYKIKSPTYLSLHKMRGEGDNLFHPKYLIDFALAGEAGELLTYFPEAESQYKIVEHKINEEYDKLKNVWKKYWTIKNQKEFALAVKENAFSSILFNIRKNHGQNQTNQHLDQIWRNSKDLILKKLFKSHTLGF